MHDAQPAYAGDLATREAFDLVRDDDGALLVDVRTPAERTFVGVPQVPGREPLHVTWPGGSPDPAGEFLRGLAEVGITPGHRGPVVFLCRSGKRSVAAATAATAAGIGPSYNVLDGFEGDLDADGHRGGAGWRADGLPWRQS